MERIPKSEIESYLDAHPILDTVIYAQDDRQQRPGFFSPVTSEFILDKPNTFKVVVYIERFSEDGESIVLGEPRILYEGQDLDTAVKIYNDNY